MDHTAETYLPATCRFFISILNESKEDLTVDCEDFVTLDVGEYKIKPKTFKKEDPPVIELPEDHKPEDDIIVESEMSQMITQLKLNETSKLFSIRGILCDEIIKKLVLKPNDYVTCEMCFSILMEYRYESDFLKECKKMYFVLTGKELISFESGFDAMEITEFYKGFVPGYTMAMEKGKKYPTWKGTEVSRPIQQMTEEEWLQSMEK
jgi:hypothetical protein